MAFDPNLFSAPFRDVAKNAVAVTPSNTASFELPVALYVGTAGDVAVRDIHGRSATFRNVPAGSILPVYVTRVMATGTTASDIVGLS